MYIDVGDALHDALTDGYAIEIAVHEPQLLPSFDSLTFPFVSAQARMYQVPADGGVYDTETVVEPPEPIAFVDAVPILLAPAPPAELAISKRAVEEPAVASPPFVTVA